MEPTLSFIYNYGSSDTPYGGAGGPVGDWKILNAVVSGTGTPDTLVFTGGGINGTISTPTATYGSRDATIRPVSGAIPIPQTFVESESDNIMYNVPMAGRNSNRYVMGVYIDGYLASDLYLEYWDDYTFSSTNLPTLSGTTNYAYSMVNGISTTLAAPPSDWHQTTNSGTCLAGYDNRIGLKGSSSIENEAVYYNIYILLPYDAPLFHNQPVQAFRYLYI